MCGCRRPARTTEHSWSTMGCGRVRQQPPTGCLHGWHWSTYGCHEVRGLDVLLITVTSLPKLGLLSWQPCCTMSSTLFVGAGAGGPPPNDAHVYTSLSAATTYSIMRVHGHGSPQTLVHVLRGTSPTALSAACATWCAIGPACFGRAWARSWKSGRPGPAQRWRGVVSSWSQAARGYAEQVPKPQTVLQRG